MPTQVAPSVPKGGEVLMRIYTRAAFLALPAGTLYCKCRPWVFEELCVKEDSWPNDFVFVNLQTIDSSSSEESTDRLDRMLEEGVSFPLNNATQRDGCFDETDLFLVYEQADLKALMTHCLRAAQASL
jgi:hypothetical protein